MPNTYYGPYNEQYSDYANAGNANLGRWPLGHILMLPDNREYRFALNDGTAEVAARLYQSVAALAGHTDIKADVVRAIGAVAVSATLNTTLAGVDIYAEGVVHINDDVGEGYAHRIKMAMNAGDANAATVATGVLTVNLDAGEKIQVALTTASDITFSRNRFHSVLIHPSPPTGGLAGVSPGVAAASRFYWSQVRGYAAVLAAGTLLAGLPVMPSTATDGAVESTKRRIQTGGTTALVNSATMSILYLLDQDGTTTGHAIVGTTTMTTAAVDVTSGIANNAPTVGVCIKANIASEEALIDLSVQGT